MRPELETKVMLQVTWLSCDRNLLNNVSTRGDIEAQRVDQIIYQFIDAGSQRRDNQCHKVDPAAYS